MTLYHQNSQRRRLRRRLRKRAQSFVVVLAAAHHEATHVKHPIRPSSRIGKSTRWQRRVSVAEIFQQLGPTYFARAYQMKYQTFEKLVSLLLADILRESGKSADSKNFIPNGCIHPSVRIAAALRYFAGGQVYDIMTSFGIGHTDAMDSVWYVVDAINKSPSFKIEFPTDHAAQQDIARSFKSISDAGFACCVGAMDGLLIWILKPSEKECKILGCSSGKFFCSRKHKFGLNCQAVCNARGRFIDFSFVFPGSTSDCLAFEDMTLFRQLEQGILAPGLCFFGNSAYLNSTFMATPFPSTAGGSRDAYNFYHSQVRIRIECAFGMLTHRWSILRSAMPLNISVCKTIALCVSLAKLHNFCIDESDAVSPASASDELNIELSGSVPLVPIPGERESATDNVAPSQLLGGGQHFDDMDRNTRRRRTRQNDSSEGLPRNNLLLQIEEKDLCRPTIVPRHIS